MNIGIPSNFVTNVASSSTSVVTQASTVVTVLIGMLLAFWLLHYLVDLMNEPSGTVGITGVSGGGTGISGSSRATVEPAFGGGEYLVGGRWLPYDAETR